MTFKLSFNSLCNQRLGTEENPYRCSQCDKSIAHICTIEKPYQCSQCDKLFLVKSCFIVHRRLHTGEKSYECSDCDKAF